MDKIVIEGGRALRGEVTISGAKNAALPILFSTILCEGVSTIDNVPDLADIKTTISLLETVGCKITRDGDKVTVDSTTINFCKAPYDLVRTMRASCLMLGPLLARCGKISLSLPGGCAIGARPIDLHIKALELMGASVSIEHGYVNAHADKLIGNTIYFDTITVTGTENIIMAAVLAEGITKIENAAREPEIINLCQALIDAGAKITGAGEPMIVIEGVKALKPLNVSIIPDRIEAGTFLVGALITDGDVTLKNCNPQHLDSVLSKLKEMGAKLEIGQDTIRITRKGPLKAANIRTAPYPGFPTDLQAQFMALAVIINGTSVIEETIFENRFMHVAEMLRMNASISVNGRTAVVKGGAALSGARVMATDLRASASLILAGLVADGITQVRRVYHLDRGYVAMEKKLQKLGANIKRQAE